jgi:hypothetical protein
MTRASLSLLCLLLAGCPPVKMVTDAGRPNTCSKREDCSAGKICNAQMACDNCESSGQCRTRELCEPMTRLCALRPGWGESCTTNEQCQAGSWCKQGLCLDRSEVSLCPGGTKAECPQGDRCNTITTICEEDLGCSDDLDCSMGEVCNTGSRSCVPRCTAETQADVCAPGEKCVAEKCVQCSIDAECGVGLKCDAAGKCSTGSRCYTDRDCKIPLICFAQTGACLAKAPPCVSDDNCPSDERCDVGAGKCIPRTCQPDRYEPDNDLTKAYGVASGRYNNLTLCPGDVDWYSITLARGDQLGVNLDADPFSENNFSTVVKDGTSRTLASGKLLVSYVASAPQKYYVVVSTIDPFQPYDISFLLSRGTPCDDDSHEPNDSEAAPTSFNLGTSLEGAICPQDQDWYKVAVPAGKGLKVSFANYDSSKGLLRLCAFDGMTQLGCDDSTMPSVTSAEPAVGGKQVLIRVVGSSERAANAYTLKVEFL